jgi:hypothetical protein
MQLAAIALSDMSQETERLHWLMPEKRFLNIRIAGGPEKERDILGHIVLVLRHGH